MTPAPRAVRRSFPNGFSDTRPAGQRPDPELRMAVEDFLYQEAALLDEWRLDEWVELFTDDASYVVPATDLPAGDPDESLVLISDNLDRIRGRVRRLNSRKAYREFPVSRTRRLIGNVRILGVTEEEVDVTCNFVVYRVRRDVNVYVGRYLYRLVRQPEGFRIRLRRAELDLESLRPHGTLSIIL
jgi:p-cumate 2,3-dioxygenase beta subunit